MSGVIERAMWVVVSLAFLVLAVTAFAVTPA
jgi:hypothetical protein